MAIATKISTDMVDDKLRNDFWRALIKPMYEIPLNKDNRDYQFQGTISARRAGPIQIGATTFNAQDYVRTPQVIAQSGLDHYILQVITGGTLKGDFNGIDVAAQQGDIVVIDLAQTVASRADAGSRVTVVIPRDSLERIVGWRNLHGLVMRANNPITRLLFDYLRGLQSVSGELNGDEAHSAQEAMLTLLGAGITGSEGGALEKLPINLPMRKRILAYIDDNLPNPLLGPHSIIQYFRVSRSHLYRAFVMDGGVAKVIRDKRLDCAYRILISQSGKPVSFKEIAYRCGFHNGTQFTKAFKVRFGMSPKDARIMGAPLLSSDPDAFSYPIHLTKEAAKVGIIKP